MSVHKIFIFLLQCFVNFWRFDQFYEVFYPDNNNYQKIKKEKKKRKENAESMDRSCKFEGGVTQKLDGTWLLCDCSNGVCSPNVLKKIIIMLFPQTHSIDFGYGAIEVNVMEICVAKSLSLIWR